MMDGDVLRGPVKTITENGLYDYKYTTTVTGITITASFKVAAHSALTPTTVTPIVLSSTRAENDLKDALLTSKASIAGSVSGAEVFSTYETLKAKLISMGMVTASGTD